MGFICTEENEGKKDKAWTVFDADPTTANLYFANSKQGIYETEEVKAKLRYEKKITENLKTNCKAFYSYLRNKRKVKSCVPSLDKDDGSRTTSAAESAEVLASEPSGPLPKSSLYSTTNHIISDININR